LLPFFQSLRSSVHDLRQEIGNSFGVLEQPLFFILRKMTPQALAEHDLEFSGSQEIAVHNGVTRTQAPVPQQRLATRVDQRLYFLIHVLVHIGGNRLVQNKIYAIAA
jgi:hypothetical protein